MADKMSVRVYRLMRYMTAGGIEGSVYDTILNQLVWPTRDSIRTGAWDAIWDLATEELGEFP